MSVYKSLCCICTCAFVLPLESVWLKEPVLHLYVCVCAVLVPRATRAYTAQCTCTVCAYLQDILCFSWTSLSTIAFVPYLAVLRMRIFWKPRLSMRKINFKRMLSVRRTVLSKENHTCMLSFELTGYPSPSRCYLIYADKNWPCRTKRRKNKREWRKIAPLPQNDKKTDGLLNYSCSMGKTLLHLL